MNLPTNTVDIVFEKTQNLLSILTKATDRATKENWEDLLNQAKEDMIKECNIEDRAAQAYLLDITHSIYEASFIACQNLFNNLIK